MNKKQFTLWNRIVAALVFVVSAVTYLATMEPTASFWDCGEFIASSYKLEVGHPPGNPVFQLFARIFTLFGDNMHAAILVNSCSAICSALTILLLYLTIVFFVKRILKPAEDGSFSLGAAIAVMGSGVVGGLAYAFSDTFWFSAVEAEVYAMSSLLTALVFWLMTKWYEQADEPGANRWIVLICFVMGLSIGVHLLNLLAAPALIYMYYYRKRENSKYNFWQLTGIMALSAVVLFLMVFIFIPYLPKLAAYFDLFFVNTLGTPFNVGAIFFLVLLFSLLFWGMYITIRKGKVFINTILVCVTTICVGFSLFSIDVIRSNAKTPTNEYQPDNAFTLVRYLSREQYGKTPLVVGQYFDAEYGYITDDSYWAPMPVTNEDGSVKDAYKYVPSPIDVKYHTEDQMLFPRMWSPGVGGNYKKFYEDYYPRDSKDRTRPDKNELKEKKFRVGDDGKKKAYERYKKPSMGTNLRYFFGYQMHWMYWRYFMWNFVGRQNDIHSPSPGNRYYGNWESGISFIDNARLGDHSDAPEALAGNKGKNHYFFLPLLLGLLGLFFQFNKDKRGSWLVFLLFFMTGIAIVLYLNQPPYQVRERDYAYAGSFYAFAIWIGLGVAAIYSWIKEVAAKKETIVAGTTTAVCLLGVPVLMAEENWDDHDRSNRYTAVEMATNYLNSVGKNGILVTHGDNDTFPLWYAQEVEECRTDVRICNTSLLGTDWHIDQMKYACNESAPLPLTIGPEQYLYGTNDYVYVVDINGGEVLSLSQAMELFKDPSLKMTSDGDIVQILRDGRLYSMYQERIIPKVGERELVDFFPARKVSIPVNKENVLKYGILPQNYSGQIPDEIVLELPSTFGKPDLFMLDLLNGYEWDRPIHMLNMGGDVNMGIKPYLMNLGFSAVFTPIRNNGKTADTDTMYHMMTDVYKFDKLGRKDFYVDYQNAYTFMGVTNVRNMFANAAQDFFNAKQYDRAEEMLDKGLEAMAGFPLSGIHLSFGYNDSAVIRMIYLYYRLADIQNPDAPEDVKYAKAERICRQYWKEVRTDLNYFADSEEISGLAANLISNFINIVDEYGTEALRSDILPDFQDQTGFILGSTKADVEDLHALLDAIKEENTDIRGKVLEYYNVLSGSMSFHLTFGDEEHFLACYRMGVELHDELDSLGEETLASDLASSLNSFSTRYKQDYE